MITPVKRIKLQPKNFPTQWQTVIYRNYRIVPTENIAVVLDCSTDTVTAEAARLGLEIGEHNPEWLKSGYITVIRNNWNILPIEQLLILLDMSEDKLDLILKDEDFLSVKLGNAKPECDKVCYMPLTQEQILDTERLASVTSGMQAKQHPFDFFSAAFHRSDSPSLRTDNFIHGYITPCGDAFATDSCEYLPDSLLQRYAELGVSGIWLHGVLSSLSPYPFIPELSANYKLKRKNLKDLIDRAAKFGLKIYLYFDEPRFIPKGKAQRYAHLFGHETDGGYSLCMSYPEVREYLRDAICSLLSECRLGGIMTITMSEYQTHCRTRTATNCPVCKGVGAEELAALVNNTILEGIRLSGADTELIANIWGWSSFLDWTPEMTAHGIELLDRDISVLAVSEFDLPIEKGGVKNRVIDYSISNPGPSPTSTANLTLAKRLGHKVYAKIQVNNSWECSAVPYLPVFELVREHLDNLYGIGVESYMLSWTNGGYPSPTLDLVSTYKPNTTLDSWYKKTYGEAADAVSLAVKKICDGFREYPFSCSHLYFSPQTLGPANMWSLEPDEKKSSMVCFAYDDLETWLEKYPYEIFISQTQKMLDGWKEGNRILSLEQGKRPEVDELFSFSEAAYIHLECDLLQTKWSYLKRNVGENRDELISLTRMAETSVRRLIELISTDSRIGYEASNHYYYTDSLLKEKLMNLYTLRSRLEGEF